MHIAYIVFQIDINYVHHITDNGGLMTDQK